MSKQVTIIPAKLNRATFTPLDQPKKRKVAGYARVSTDSEEQQTSYEARVSYYTEYIQKRADWEFAGVYTDQGISATNTKHRDGFNRMIADALDGKIDLIVTKSVSRFARNTVDSLTTVRKLKEKGVEVYFEKENIYTLDSKGELFITIMSSLAQEESRSISENVTWGQRKRMVDGKVTMPYGRFLGYRKGEDGLPEIVPEEAEVVRLIYKSFMEGMSYYKIAKMLMGMEIPAPAGGEKWHRRTVESILTNEKYKGSALLQKKFTVDFLTKKQKVNEGEVPQYFVEHSHDAIIAPEEYELVQAEIERRKGLGKEYSGRSIFSAKLVCSCCGGFFGSKVWHSTSKYRRVIWQCNHKFKNGEKCKTPHLYEDDIKKRFIEVCNRIASDKEDFLLSCQQIVEMLTNTAALDKKIESQYIYLNGLAVSMQEFIKENAMKPQDEDFYKKKMAEYNAQKAEAEKVLHNLQDKRAARLSRKELLEGLIRTMSREGIVTDNFDAKLWLLLVEKATVGTDGKLNFTLRNGMEIEV
ncbi:MAG TPA: recombinase family protein [Ruminococcus flavefaciens]|nr:recombinase family protein [Ruminococcus flavefaciens]